MCVCVGGGEKKGVERDSEREKHVEKGWNQYLSTRIRLKG